MNRLVVDETAAVAIGRRREIEILVAALLAARHVVLEGPPGTGKSTLLHALAVELDQELVFVEGNAELTPARLGGYFDPALVLSKGYAPDVYVDGPLARAMRHGCLLYIEELNRIPEETLNLLVTVMSERVLVVPRLGPITAAPAFRIVAAMNPFDAVGTSRIAGAIYDRVCRISLGYQSEADEIEIVTREAPAADPAFVRRAVLTVRATRDHPEIRIGSSVRGAIDLAHLADQLRPLRDPHEDVGLDSALAALSGRIRINEGSNRSPEDVIAELWARFAPHPVDPNAEPARTDKRSDSGGDNPTPAPETEEGAKRGPAVVEGLRTDRTREDAGRRTTPRSVLQASTLFASVSPNVGEIDEAAVEAAMEEHPDAMLSLLGDMTTATDEGLRRLAARLAARVVLRFVDGRPARPGTARLSSSRADVTLGDVEIDASLPAIISARAAAEPLVLDELWVQEWRKPSVAVCLLIDCSGSMGGDRLSSAAVAAAAIATGTFYQRSVIAFNDVVDVIERVHECRAPGALVADVLRLRGRSTTNLALGLHAARDELARSGATHSRTILLSDCRRTVGASPERAASDLDELQIIAPADASEDAARLARSVGARWAALEGPSDLPGVLTRLAS